jgi:ABC-type multidrug transport system fused ATPase/permease subunit
MGSVLERALGAIRTVKASGAEGREAAALNAAAERAYEEGLRNARYQALVGTSTGLAVQVAFLAVLGVGGARVAGGSLAVGDLIAFLLYLFNVSEPISGIAAGATQLQAGVAAVHRLEDVAELAVEQDDALTAAASGDGPLVSFDEVGFRYVEQEAPVLAGTLRANLLYAAPDAGDAELRAVLATTRLEDLVASLPDGLDTEVGARGTTLSGGERQRVAIAHRLSTVVAADRIVVLDGGRVRAQGTHPELVEADDLYRELAATQLTA